MDRTKRNTDRTTISPNANSPCIDIGPKITIKKSKTKPNRAVPKKRNKKSKYKEHR